MGLTVFRYTYAGGSSYIFDIVVNCRLRYPNSDLLYIYLPFS